MKVVVCTSLSFTFVSSVTISKGDDLFCFHCKCAKEDFWNSILKAFAPARGECIGEALSMKFSDNLFCCIYDRLKVFSMFIKLKAANVMNVRWTLWTPITDWCQSLMKFESRGTASKNMKVHIGIFQRKWMYAWDDQFIGKAFFPIVMQT